MIKEKYKDIDLKTINSKSSSTSAIQEVAETILNKRINNKLLG